MGGSAVPVSSAGERELRRLHCLKLKDDRGYKSSLGTIEKEQIEGV